MLLYMDWYHLVVLVVFQVDLVQIREINPMVNRRYVAVADPVVASLDQTHTHHSFTIVIESCCYTLIDTNQPCSACSKSICYESDNQPMVNSRYVAVADPVVASFDQTHTQHWFTIVFCSRIMLLYFDWYHLVGLVVFQVDLVQIREINPW